MVQTIEIIEGDDRFFFLPIKIDGETATIDGCRFWLTGKRAPAVPDDQADFQLSTENGLMTIYDTGSAIVRAHLLPEHTIGKVGRIYVDVQMRDTDEITSTACRAVFNIIRQITRA